MVRAKFTFSSYETHLSTREKRDEEGRTVRDNDGRAQIEQVELRTLFFRPVYGNNDPKHENTAFWRATPSGEVKLGTVNPEAWAQFELGKEYYLDFSAAAAPGS